MPEKRKNDDASSKPLTTLLVIVGAIIPPLLAFLLIAAFVIPSSKSSTQQADTQETVVIPFDRFVPTLTQYEYKGKVRLFIAGTGQAAETAYSDAFYLYTDAQGNPLNPPQMTPFDLEIDGQQALVALGLAETPPEYQADHTYSMIYDVGSKSRKIAFGLSDSHAGDNTGQFTIDVVQLH